MKQKIVLLVVIAILLAAGYVAWDRSFREEITHRILNLQKSICSRLTTEQKICRFLTYMINTTTQSLFMPKVTQGLRFSIRIPAISSVQDRAVDIRVTYQRSTNYIFSRLSGILSDPQT